MKKNLLYILFSIIGALFDFGFSVLGRDTLRLPLFIDTIGTYTMTLVAGPLYGTLCAVIYAGMSIFGAYKSVSLCLYAICSVSEVFILYYCFVRPMRRAEERGLPWFSGGKIARLVLIAIFLCVLTSVTGGIIATINTIYFNTPDISSFPEVLFKAGFMQQGMPVLAANILSRIPVNIVDRPLCLIAAFGIYNVVTHNSNR
jgi:hypothetical protein